MSDLEIGSVQFTPEGDTVLITYMDLVSDRRNRGLVQMTHQVAISRGTEQDYAEEFDALRDAAMALLVDALEDFTSSPPAENVSPRPTDDDDDEDA